MEHVEVAETGGHPVVYADWLHAEGAPPSSSTATTTSSRSTRSISGTSPPFEPVVAATASSGRGAADDKGQLHLHLRAAEALLATRGSLPVNLQVVFEGEEESSSVHLDAWLDGELRPPRPPTVAVISDTGFFEGNIPAITVALRGLHVRPDRRDRNRRRPALRGLRRRGPEPGERAGPDHRGLKDADGRVLVPGFYDDVAELTRGRPRGASPRCRSTRRPTWRRLGVPALSRRARLLDPRAPGRPADARRQRHLGRLPGRGAQDHHPGPRPRQGQLPARRRPGPRADLRGVRELRRDDRPARASGRGPVSRRRPPEPHPDRPPRDPGRGAGPPGDVRPGAGLHPRGRLDPGLRELRADPRPAGRPARIHPPDEHAHAPNEWMDLANYETGIRTDRPALGRDRRSAVAGPIPDALAEWSVRR